MSSVKYYCLLSYSDSPILTPLILNSKSIVWRTEISVVSQKFPRTLERKWTFALATGWRARQSTKSKIDDICPSNLVSREEQEGWQWLRDYVQNLLSKTVFRWTVLTKKYCKKGWNRSHFTPNQTFLLPLPLSVKVLPMCCRTMSTPGLSSVVRGKFNNTV